MDYGEWTLSMLGVKVQKLAVDAGLGCPNRDGTLGRGGCTYCSNRAFSPRYCDPSLSITEQLERGKHFFRRKYPQAKFLAYFQSHTNTHAPVAQLMALYEEALSVTDVVGLVIATRPDCMPDTLLDSLAELSRRTFLIIEYGIESASDETLLRIHRGHTFRQAEETIRRTADKGIFVGGHIILGFPWESREELLHQAEVIGRLPLTTLKIHQLQVIRGTQMAREYEAHPWPMPTAEEYADLLLDYISRLPHSIVLERFVSQSPPDMVIAPQWGLKSSEFAKLLQRKKNF